MITSKNVPGLSFFTVSKYQYKKHEICDFRESPRPHYCMGLILDGEGTFKFGAESVSVKRGDIIFVPVGSRYCSEWSGTPDIEYISMHFFFLSPGQFAGNKTLNIQKISPEFEGEFDSYFIKAHESYENDNTNSFFALSCFFGIMSIISPRLVFSGENKYDDRIERAVMYLAENYMENMTIEELAVVANMSVSHFHAMFKLALGMTPIEYRNHIRVRYAIMSLIRGNESIEQISDSLGFKSTTYFRRAFKKETGCAPSKYTKKNIEI